MEAEEAEEAEKAGEAKVAPGRCMVRPVMKAVWSFPEYSTVVLSVAICTSCACTLAFNSSTSAPFPALALVSCSFKEEIVPWNFSLAAVSSLILASIRSDCTVAPSPEKG